MKIQLLRAALAVWIAVFAPSLLATNLWVSPSGNDANAGTESAPFRTLEHAVEVANAATDAVTINVADGTYRIAHSLAFAPGPQSVAMRAVPGAHPIVSGAVQITGWTLHDKTRNIWQANAGSNVSRQLYVDGRRATRARTDSPNGNIPAGFRPNAILPQAGATPYVITGGIQYQPTSLNAAGWRDPSKWTNKRDVEAVVETQWKVMSVPVDSITAPANSQPGLIKLRQPGWTNANLYLGSNPVTCAPGPPSIWSFWQVTRFENAYEFLDEPGEWYLDQAKGVIDYIPRHGEDPATADFELPVRETLVQAIGTPANPLANLSFEGLTFEYATWLDPAKDNGYVSDQSGFRVLGQQPGPNLIGHVQDVTRTPGNLRFAFAQNVSFIGNTFTHLGAVALDLGSGSRNDVVKDNIFTDISSAAIQLGGVGANDARPPSAGYATTNNTIANNVIVKTGREYGDTAAIFVGFTSKSDVSHNSISDTAWSGIAIGWGWGLLDQSGYLGVGCATKGMWGTYTTPTINSSNRIAFNHIERFLQNRWDGGAIYSTGQQGTSMSDPLVLEGNVANDKTASSGGNTFYTDGGSRYVLLKGNASYSNPIGKINLGPPPRKNDPLPYPALFSLFNIVPYGSDSGGCRTYGDIQYTGNYWMEGTIPLQELLTGSFDLLVSKVLHINPPFDPYSKEGFFDVCPYSAGGVSYPTNLSYTDNHYILGSWEIPRSILNNAGVKP